MGRPVVHWELMSTDPAKVAAFYEQIFGWKVNQSLAGDLIRPRPAQEHRMLR
jgi:predicted enzyme related to lactoylglutathione lyase